ncbi:MAG: cyclase family protein, partial [Alphaproteobacteria bacterium]|nr:cyclase family protein [Alphaproteobacteria bacterium]
MKNFTRAAAFAAVLSMAATGALADETCEVSKWGEGDELGAANLLSPERTLEALKLVRQGKTLPLGIVIGPETPAFPPRSMSLQVVQPNQQGGQKLTEFGYPGNYNDDLLQTWIGIGSQLD